MVVGGVYQLSFAHSWESNNLTKLFARWNDVVFYNNTVSGPERVFSTYTQILPVITFPENTLCFSGQHPTSNSSFQGPLVDNVLVVYLYGNNSTTSSPNNDTMNISNNTNSVNTTNTNTSLIDNSTFNSTNLTINNNTVNINISNSTNSLNSTNNTSISNITNNTNSINSSN